MVKRALTLLTSILFALPLLMPFNIYAESIDSHIRGRNYNFEVIQTEKVNTNNIYVNSGIYHVTFELDDNYIGYILPNYTIEYKNYFYGSNPPNWGNSSSSFNRRVFINGSSFSFDVPITWYSNGAFSVNGGSDPYVYDSYTISSSDVTKTSDIDSIDKIVTILTDLYNSNDQVEGLLNNQLAQLQQVVANTNLANTYLETISKLRQYDFPFESFTYVYYCYRNFGESAIINNTYFEYPMFTVTAGTQIPILKRSTNLNQIGYCIFGINSNVWNLDAFMTLVQSVNNCQITKFEIINRVDYQPTISIVKLTVKNTSTDNEALRTLSFKSDRYFIPIYMNDINFSAISTDFALTYGLSNQLLEDIHLIANGTTASQSAAQSSDSANSQLQTDSNTLFQQENDFKSDMQNAMQNVNNTFRLQDMGTKFVNSAQWIRTQFEMLTNNTPFASLITFSLITGLALILLGKVYR